MNTTALLPAIETPAFVIREIEARDARAFAMFMADQRYQQHIAFRLRDTEEITAFVMRNRARQGDGRRHVIHLAAELKSEHAAVGDGFLILGRDARAEIGWGLAPRLWGRGLGTEIGSALLALAFERLGAGHVWCKVMSGNAASLRLARRIGLQHAESHPDYPAGGGRFQAVEFFALDAAGYFDLTY